MTVKNVKTGEITRVEADPGGRNVRRIRFIGYIPRTDLFEGVIDMENGYIKTDDNMHTNIPVFLRQETSGLSL